MRLTKAQIALMDELTYWHAMLTLGETNIGSTVFGLCYLSRELLENYDNGESWGNEHDKFFARALAHKPKRPSGWMGLYWWPIGEWAPRRRFILRMIRLVEQELRES